MATAYSVGAAGFHHYGDPYSGPPKCDHTWSSADWDRCTWSRPAPPPMTPVETRIHALARRNGNWLHDGR